MKLFLRSITFVSLALHGITAFAQFGTTADDAPAIAKRSMDQKVQTMLLGTYHFNNPGQDEYNTKVDDYFTDKRQKEILEVVDRIADFKPNKVFIEAMPGYQQLMNDRYEAFVKGELDLKDLKNGRSETYQIGFRVAKKCGLSKLDCVDAPGAWLGNNVKQVAARMMPKFMTAIQMEKGKIFAQENKKIVAQTVCQNLINHNTTESIMRNHSYYNQVAILVNDSSKPAKLEYDKKKVDGNELTMIGVEQNNIGAELVGKWYTRNIKIFANIIRKVEPEDERILVLFGQGHIRPIRHFFEDHPIFELVETNDYLKK